MVWPILLRVVRVYAPYVTLPFAAVVGFIGYNLENIMGTKYTPYSKPIKEQREERLLSDNVLESAMNPGTLKLSAHVLDQNLSPSLAD